MVTWTYDYSRKGSPFTFTGRVRATTESSARKKAQAKHGKDKYISNVRRR